MIEAELMQVELTSARGVELEVALRYRRDSKSSNKYVPMYTTNINAYKSNLALLLPQFTHSAAPIGPM